MTLKEHLMKIDPSMDEKLIDEFVAMVDTSITEAKKTGFNEGIAKVEEMDAEQSEKMESLFEELKVKHTTALTELEEKLTADHEAALAAQDEEYTEMFNEALNAQDELQTSMLDEIVEKLDTDYTTKLDTIEEAFKTQYEVTITEKVNEFIDTYIAESVPEEVVVDLAKLRRLEECMDSIRETLVINDDFVQTEVKEALEDAQSQIDERQEKINSLMVENMDIRKKIKQGEAASLLEKKTADMKPALAAYVEKYFDGVNDPKVISEKLDDAVKAFTANEKVKKDEVIEEKRGVTVEIPDEQEPPVIEESQDEDHDMQDLYVQKIHRSYSIENNLE